MNYITRDLGYFKSEDFNCSKEHLINEAIARAEHWFKNVDGSYDIPRVGGQLEQLIEMLIAAKLKETE